MVESSSRQPSTSAQNKALLLQPPRRWNLLLKSAKEKAIFKLATVRISPIPGSPTPTTIVGPFLQVGNNPQLPKPKAIFKSANSLHQPRVRLFYSNHNRVGTSLQVRQQTASTQDKAQVGNNPHQPRPWLSSTRQQSESA
jgi:hypothetical protein